MLVDKLCELYSPILIVSEHTVWQISVVTGNRMALLSCALVLYIMLSMGASVCLTKASGIYEESASRLNLRLICVIWIYSLHDIDSVCLKVIFLFHIFTILFLTLIAVLVCLHSSFIVTAARLNFHNHFRRGYCCLLSDPFGGSSFHNCVIFSLLWLLF